MKGRRGWLQAGVQLGLLGLLPRSGSTAGYSRAGNGKDDPEGWPGRLDGIWHWRLPDTPNGLHPTQSWHATGSGPDGSIYIGGMDHATNSALYGIRAGTKKLRLLGDARSASERANNWQPGETAEKFHTRPLWHHGKVYVATMDQSTLDDQYLSRRGFHLYAYDPAQDSFTDLSAGEPGGTGAPHGGLVTLASDPERNVIYGAGVPTAEIFRYDVATGRTEKLGRPAAFDQPYVYANRVMWLDSRGRLYLTAGNPDDPGPRVPPLKPSIYGHVHYYDPERREFGELRDWKLKEPRALEVGQWLPGRKACLFSDDRGHIYRFQDDPLAWEHVGTLDLPTGGPLIWVLHVSPDGDKAYAVLSMDNKGALYEFDIAGRSTRRLGVLSELDPAFIGRGAHTGHDAWDDAGGFYFTSFSSESQANVLLTRIDPARLKAALARRSRT